MVVKATRTATRARGPRETGEDRRADALTVLWMLAAVATLAAEAVAGIAKLVLWVLPNQAPLSPLANVLPGWFMFCALITGLLCLLLTPITWWVRKRKPPASITVTAMVIGLLPVAIALWQVFSER